MRRVLHEQKSEQFDERRDDGTSEQADVRRDMPSAGTDEQADVRRDISPQLE